MQVVTAAARPIQRHEDEGRWEVEFSMALRLPKAVIIQVVIVIIAMIVGSVAL